MAAFTSAWYQRGHGLGNILHSLTKFAVPFLKKGAKAVGKQAMKMGMNIAQEAMRGQNITKAAKQHLSQGLTELVTQQGRGRPKRKPRRGPPRERVKRRKVAVPRRTNKPKRGYKRKATSNATLISHSAKRRRTSKKDIFG